MTSTPVPRRVAVLAVLLCGMLAVPAYSQWTVRDPAVIARNRITAGLAQLQAATQRLQREQWFRMARRLVAFTNLIKYAVEETPEWRIHDFWTEAVLYARDYHAALNYGDRLGASWRRLTIPILRPDQATPPGLSQRGWRELSARMATLETADAVAISTTHDAGLLRYNGRREQQAIEGLQAHVIDSSEEQSTSAVLDKIAGAVLVGTRQRQARSQFIAGIVEQLVLETKRGRDTDATALNMQLTTWRDGDAVNRAMAVGTGDALETWRQP